MIIYNELFYNKLIHNNLIKKYLMIFRFIIIEKLYSIHFVFEYTFFTVLLKNNSVIWLKINKLLQKEIHERVLKYIKKREEENNI